MNPPIHGVHGTGADARDAQRGRLTQRGIDKTAHRELCRYAAAPGAAHAVGQRGDHAGS